MKQAIALGLSTVVSLAFAADTNSPPRLKTADLPPVVVVASRIGQTPGEMPCGVCSFNADTIRDSHSKSFAEFVDRETSAFVRTVNANPLQAQVALRGYGENSFGRCKIIIDGEELNAVEMESPNIARISLDQLERIEVLPGPQTVLHGDSSSAGVINVLTEKPGGDALFFSAHGGSCGTFGATARRTGLDKTSGNGYKASYNYLRSDGWRDNSGYQLHEAQAFAYGNFADETELVLSATSGYADYEMPGALTEAQYFENPRQSSRMDDTSRTWHGGLGLALKSWIDDATRLNAGLRYFRKERRTRWGEDGYANDYALDTLAFDPRLIVEGDNLEHGGRFTLGLDSAWDSYHVKDASGFMPPSPVFNRLRAAGFAHGQLGVSETLSLVAGVRHEEIWNRWEDNGDFDDAWRTFSLAAYEAGVVYTPSEDVKTYVRHTRFFRSPFCDEMSYCEPGGELRPETGYSLDAGAKASLAEDFEVAIDAYASRTRDEIFYNPYHSPSSWGWNGYNCNSPADVVRTGLDLSAAWKRDDAFALSAKYSLVNAQFDGGQFDGRDVPLVPASRLRAEVKVRLCSGLHAQAGYSHTGRQQLGGDFHNAHGGLASYGLVDFGLSYKPQTPRLKGFRLTLAIDNAFDKRFCDYAGYSDFQGTYFYPAAGRATSVSASFDF